MQVSEQRDQPDLEVASAPRGEPITVRPPFDPQEFARKADSQIRTTEVPRLPYLPPTVPPPPDLPSYPMDVTPIAAPLRAHEHGDAIPAMAVTRADLDWFDLSPLAHRLLIQINDRDSVATICARCGVDVADAFNTIEELARDGVILLGDIRG